MKYKEIIQDGSIYYDVPCKKGCGITMLHEDEINMDYLCYECSGSWGIIKIEELSRNIEIMYRVYKVDDTPLEGSEEYFDISTQKMAIKLVKYLNKHSDYKKWVWA